ncbi:MAG: lauroyl acyltransferase [Mariprofundaceae bacterium]|nr:lauroyl acyltransferase [Mariprofundaceae bacterium]
MALWLFKALFSLLYRIPVRWLGALGAGLGRVLYYALAKHRRITRRNLRRAYPQHEAAWHHRTGRESFAELGRTMFELPYVFLASRDDLLTCVTIEGADEVQAAMQQQGVILAAAHHSNWELGGLMASMVLQPFAMIYRPMKNNKLDGFLRQCRERFGMKTYSRFDGIRWLPPYLRDGGAVGIMVDQHMSQGMQVPFMGHLANTTTLPAMFALRQHTPIYSIFLHRVGHDFRFRLVMEPISLPEAGDNREDNQYQIMAAIGERVAARIDERPELWLWLHKRWWILEHDPHAV